MHANGKPGGHFSRVAYEKKKRPGGKLVNQPLHRMRIGRR